MSARLKTQQANSALQRRIRAYYAALNNGEYERCYEMIDPRVRHRPTSVTLHRYVESLKQFMQRHQRIQIQETKLNLHLDQPSKLYENRDFATGTSTWVDKAGQQDLFHERWVREGRSWYTVCVGYVTPES